MHCQLVDKQNSDTAYHAKLTFFFDQFDHETIIDYHEFIFAQQTNFDKFSNVDKKSRDKLR